MAEKTKRPPRQVWLTIDEKGLPTGGHTTRKQARKDARKTERVAGPYVLAERVRER